MNINFRENTYEGMLFYANQHNMSIPALVSNICDKFVSENVQTIHAMKDGAENISNKDEK